MAKRFKVVAAAFTALVFAGGAWMFGNRESGVPLAFTGGLSAPSGAIELSDGSFLTPPDFSSATFDEDSGTVFVANQLIVDAAEGADPKAVYELISGDDGNVLSFDAMLRLYQVEFTQPHSFTDLVETAQRWEQSELIAAVDVHELYPVSDSSIGVPVGTLVSSLPSVANEQPSTTDEQMVTWGLDAINVPQARKLLDDHGKSWQDVTLGILDSGVRSVDQVAIATEIAGKDWAADLDSIAEDVKKQHGIHVAGIMVGKGPNEQGEQFSVAPGANLAGIHRGRSIPIETCLAALRLHSPEAMLHLHSCAKGSSASAWHDAALLRLLAVEGGAKVINLSIASGADSNGEFAPSHERLTSFASRIDRDVLFVSSAGNDAIETTPDNGLYIGGRGTEIADRVLTVGAMGSQTAENSGQCRFYTASYSNWGSYVDVVAPGGDNVDPKTGKAITLRDHPEHGINSTVLGGFMTGAGTSAAAPHVTGLAALVWAANPTLTAAQVRDIIIETASDPCPTFPSFNHPTTGKRMTPGPIPGGLVNAEAAVSRALGLQSENADTMDTTDPQPYATILDELARAYQMAQQHGFEYAFELDEYPAWESRGFVDTYTGRLLDEYYITDINGDGVPELILGRGEMNSLFTLVDDEPVLVETFWARSSGVLGADGTIYSIRSGGWATTVLEMFRSDPGASELTALPVTYYSDLAPGSDDQILYFKVTDGVEEQITEQEFNQASDEFRSPENSMLIDFKPISEWPSSANHQR